uniref:Ig-like domain-containing protein n=1 Tax=Trichogramma kaykai TaxID=54128 RepID=A0ABD2X6Q6_9HYME
MALRWHAKLTIAAILFICTEANISNKCVPVVLSSMDIIFPKVNSIFMSIVYTATLSQLIKSSPPSVFHKLLSRKRNEWSRTLREQSAFTSFTYDLKNTLSLGERTMEPAERHSSTNNRPRQQMLDTTTGQKSKLEPGFDLMQPTNVTSPVGKTAYLTCRVHNLGDKTVSWVRHRDIHILTAGAYTYTSDQRFQVLHRPNSGSNNEWSEWTLCIKWAQERDEGIYECQISTIPLKSHQYHLNVVVPTAAILGGPELYVGAGSTINLTCAIHFSLEPPAFIFWYYNDVVMSYDSPRGGVSVITEKGSDVTTSWLLIQAAQPSDSGEYRCKPSNANMSSIRVHVLNGERPEAMQTGTAGPILSSSCLMVSLIILYISSL